MIPRLVATMLQDRLRSFPAVGLVGPRQAGKTTLARDLGGEYFDLEQESDRIRLDLAWNRLMTSKTLIIIDEAQVWPEVFPRLRGAIDADRKRTGRFLLLGSVSPALMHHVAESLAGRLSIVELSPLLLAELPVDAWPQLWLAGGYPDGGVLQSQAFPQWELDYLLLLAQRDLPHWGLSAKPQMIDRFLRMLAAVHGQIWNATQIGQSLGLSHPTVNSYLDFLVGAFLIRRLLPYQMNLKKRLVKSPRVYWRDSGLVHALQGVSNSQQLLSQPWVGASWEGFVIEQIVGTLHANGRHFQPYFFRTSDGYEIDLVLDFGKERWAIEVKLTSEPSLDDLRRLNHAADMIDADQRYLISQTNRRMAGTRVTSCSLPHLLRHLAK